MISPNNMKAGLKKMINTIFMDIDDTIFDFNQCSYDALFETCALLNITFSEETYRLFRFLDAYTYIYSGQKCIFVSPYRFFVSAIASSMSSFNSRLIGLIYVLVFICRIRIMGTCFCSKRQSVQSVRVSEIRVPSIWWITSSLAIWMSSFATAALNFWISQSV